MRCKMVLLGLAAVGCGDGTESEKPGDADPLTDSDTDTPGPTGDTPPDTADTADVVPSTRIVGRFPANGRAVTKLVGEGPSGGSALPYVDGWYTGWVVAGPGDLDGDGLAELAVVSSERQGRPGSPGVLSVIAGAPDPGNVGLQTQEDIQLLGPTDGIRSAVTGGDVDGDGLAELMGWSTELGATDGVLVWSGSAIGAGPPAPTPILQITSGLDYANLATGADLDGDGAAEVVVAVASAGTRGRVVVVPSGARGVWDPAAAVTSIEGARDLEGFGVSLSAGDLDGDGVSELAIGGSPSNNVPDSIAIFAGSSVTGAMTSDEAVVVIAGAQNGDLFRLGAFPGDLDGDGLVDLALSGLGYDAGPIRLYYGMPDAADTQQTADATVAAAPGVLTWIGKGDPLGDFDGDGAADLLATHTDPGFPTVAVVYGPIAGATVIGAATCAIYEGAQNGTGVGDVDGDGRIDMLLGDERDNGEAGAAWLILGR